MSLLSDKTRILIDALTLTTSYVAGTVFDVQDFSETVHYIKYTPGTNGDTLHYKVEFSTDGTDWHPEPDETVAVGVGTVIPKSRVFVAITGSEQFVPALSMPVGDFKMRVLVKETVSVGHGTVTWESRASQLI